MGNLNTGLKKILMALFLLSQLLPLAAVAGEVFVEPVTGMEFVQVKGGCFKMGLENGGKNEKPVHKVCLDGYWIGKYEVTQEQYEKIIGKNPSSNKENKLPVEQVSWTDAQIFIESLNKMSKLNFRLPTEAEWEYAARSGGRDEIFSGCTEINALMEFGWYIGNSGGQTHPVGTLKANGLGIHDMSGNVWEWCQDWYDKRYYNKSPEKNPICSASSSTRVARGGGRSNSHSYLKSADRRGAKPDRRAGFLGFRLAASKLEHHKPGK